MLRKQAREASSKVAEASHAVSILSGPLVRKQEELGALRRQVSQSAQEVERGERMLRVRKERYQGPVVNGHTCAEWRHGTIANYACQQRYVGRLRQELAHLQSLTYREIDEPSLRAAMLVANEENIRLKGLVLSKEEQKLSSQEAKATAKRKEEDAALSSVQAAEHFLRQAKEKSAVDSDRLQEFTVEFQTLADHVDVLRTALCTAKGHEKSVMEAQQALEVGSDMAKTTDKDTIGEKEDAEDEEKDNTAEKDHKDEDDLMDQREKEVNDAEEGEDEHEEAEKEGDDAEANDAEEVKGRTDEKNEYEDGQLAEDEAEEADGVELQEAGEQEHAQQDQADEDETGAELEDERRAKRHRAC